MKPESFVSALFLAALLQGCTDNGETALQPVDDVVHHTGTVQLVGSTYVIIDDLASDGQQERFVPLNLPDEFKQAGMRVLFSGRRREIPPNVRMAGRPLQLSFIRIDIR